MPPLVLKAFQPCSVTATGTAFPEPTLSNEAVVRLVSPTGRRGPRTEEEIAQVAGIASNNDTVIGEMIAEAMEKVGKDGVITVEDGKSLETEVDYEKTAFIHERSNISRMRALSDFSFLMSAPPTKSVLLESEPHPDLEYGERLEREQHFCFASPTSRERRHTRAHSRAFHQFCPKWYHTDPSRVPRFGENP